MDTVRSMTRYEALKRYWRRRKYQKLNNNNNNKKRRLKIIRLGDRNSARNQPKKIKLMCLKRLVSSPIKILKNLHENYVAAMIRLAANVGRKSSGAGAFTAKKVANSKRISIVSCGEEVVDTKLVFEIYFKKLQLI